MAKRKRRSYSSSLLALLIVGVLVVAALVLAVRFWYVTLPIVAVVGGLFFYRRKRRRDAITDTVRRHYEAQQEAERQAEERREANRQAWRALSFEAGNFAVVLSGFRDTDAEEDVADFLTDIPELRDQPVEEVEALVQRAVHVKPQTVAEAVSQNSAIHLKEAIELRGGKVRIKEGVVRASDSRREPIPEKVRNEVWRRDGGQCVDCGSRERLEYDHIIAVANGGSNTARNIELRCEPCNRTKGARV